MIKLTERARRALCPDEVLLLDWHRVAICCAAAGEASLRAIPLARLTGYAGRRFRPVECDPPASALVHERAYPHLEGRDVIVDCRLRLGLRHFTTDLPDDFGLRASLGRIPGLPTQEEINDDAPGQRPGGQTS
jgi:hypothetical protein